MIRWITEKLGTAPAGDSDISKDMAVLDVRDLVDRAGNGTTATREKLDLGVALIGEGRRLVVCCDYGISRSNAIASGILCLVNGTSLEQAVREVMAKTGEKQIKLGPLRAVRAALSGTGTGPVGSDLRVLITGGSGFVGKILQQRIGDRHFTIAPASDEADLLAGSLSLDLIAKEHRINCIVHLAAPRVYTSNLALGETVTMLRNVLDVCRESSIRLVFPSSWEVYSAYRSSGTMAAESMPLYPRGPYGETKALCESLVEHHRKLYGLRCSMLRSVPLYGETGSRPKFLWNFIAKARAGTEIQTHRYLNGPPKLDLMHVHDFAGALVAAMERDIAADFNIGTGTLTSTREVAEMIVAKLGSKSVIVSRDIEEYAPNVALDSSQATSSLQWQPAVHLDEGVDRLLKAALAADGPLPAGGAGCTDTQGG